MHQNPAVKSKVWNHTYLPAWAAFPSWSIASSQRGNGESCTSKRSLSARRSTQKRAAPSFFLTRTTREAHSELDFSTIP